VRPAETAPIPPPKPEMNTTEELKNIENPCMSICDYNEDDYCVGCKRHMNEIFDWYDYTDEMRAAINKDLINRKVKGYWFE
jgi:hypothetical protein